MGHDKDIPAEWIDKPNLAEFYDGMETRTKITFDFYIKWKNTLMGGDGLNSLIRNRHFFTLNLLS
jgi:hypothetical protein